MPRDEAFERSAAADHAKRLVELLRKGQYLDARVDARSTLRHRLEILLVELGRALDARRVRSRPGISLSSVSTEVKSAAAIVFGVVVGGAIGVAAHALAMGLGIGAAGGVIVSALVHR